MSLFSVIALATLSGCADWNWNRLRGKGFGDETSNWGEREKLRPPTEPGNRLGFDTRAREIENNLGVQ